MSSAIIYGVELPVRSLCGLHHPSNMNDEAHRLLVGTCSRWGQNKINLIEYQPNTQSLECTMVWPHNAPVLHIASSPSPAHPSLFATVSPKQMRVMHVGESVEGELEESLLVTKDGVLESLWDLEGLQNAIDLVAQTTLSSITLDADRLGAERVLCDLRAPKGGDADAGVEDSFVHATVDPHHASLYLAIGATGSMYHIDSRTRALARVGNTDGIAGFGVTRCVDYSPSTANQIITGGEDGLIAIHDLRMGAVSSIAARDVSLHLSNAIGTHNHHVNKALFNSFHGLVLSCSTDETVKLWDVREADQPALLDSVDNCNDSVVDACWSSNGPWVYAGVTTSGKVVVSEIPSDVRMSILLNDST